VNRDSEGANSTKGPGGTSSEGAECVQWATMNLRVRRSACTIPPNYLL
jgi:hypothetical protein